jgi:gallate dioxygenase
MARILGGIATSHSPTIGFALDKQKQDDPAWAPIFEAYMPVRKWLAEKPGSLVALQVGVLLFPIPSAARCYKLGQSLRRAIESYTEDLSVVIVATGGLSHQVHGERAGFNNTAWDKEFLDLIENDPVKLTEITHAEYARLGGLEGAEVIMWLIMRGALSANVRKVHQTYYLPTMTGLATAIYENESAEVLAGANREYRAHIYHQLKGIENLE